MSKSKKTTHLLMVTVLLTTISLFALAIVTCIAPPPKSMPLWISVLLFLIPASVILSAAIFALLVMSMVYKEDLLSWPRVFRPPRHFVKMLISSIACFVPAEMRKTFEGAVGDLYELHNLLKIEKKHKLFIFFVLTWQTLILLFSTVPNLVFVVIALIKKLTGK